MQSLRLFCDVLTCRSFSQAAQRHGITQSAASQRVGQLEKRLGVTLIDRSVRPLRPTPEGELFLEEAKVLIERYDRLERKVSVMRRNPGAGAGAEQVSGEVIVDAIYSAGIDLLNNVRDAVEQRWPAVHVTLDYKRPDEVYAAVRNQRCHLGIVSYPQRWREVEMIPLWSEPMALVCSPSHELAGASRVYAGDMGRWPMATFEEDLPVGRAIRRYLRAHGVKPNVENVFDNIDTIKSAVAVTDEIALLPRRTVRREVQSGALKLVPIDPPLSRPMGLIFRAKQRSRVRGANGVAAEVAAPAGEAPSRGEASAEQNNGNGNGNGQTATYGFAPAVQAVVDYLVHYTGADIEPASRSTSTGSHAPHLVGEHA
jgi:DNA-binding transcriptional LysR family regulator